jgi:ribosomal protein L11 methyltransferase
MYKSLSVLVPEALADDAAALLIERGADGVEVEDTTVLKMPGREPLPAGRARLTGYFSPEGLDPALAEFLEELTGEVPAISETPVPDKDWNEVWKSHFVPIEVSPRLWVCPSWRLDEAPKSAKVLVLDPGMAFGTGTHATTSLCMEALDGLLAARPGVDVLDVGTGSGILAIACKLLGAARVVGTDNDPVAIKVALENAEINRVSLDLSTRPLGAVEGTFPVVLANIMAETLLELGPQLVAKLAPGGALFLSGILDFQADDVERAYVGLGLSAGPRVVRGEWVLLTLTR